MFTNLEELKSALAKTPQVQDGLSTIPDDGILSVIVDAFNQKDEEQRMQLAAISTAAGANTPQSSHEQRIYRDDPYWTPAYQDVLGAVRREMRLRRELAELTPILSNQEIMMMRNALAQGVSHIDYLNSRLDIADAKVSVLDVFAAQAGVISDLRHRGGTATMSVDPGHEMQMAIKIIDHNQAHKKGAWEKGMVNPCGATSEQPQTTASA